MVIFFWFFILNLWFLAVTRFWLRTSLSFLRRSILFNSKGYSNSLTRINFLDSSFSLFPILSNPFSFSLFLLTDYGLWLIITDFVYLISVLLPGKILLSLGVCIYLLDDLFLSCFLPVFLYPFYKGDVQSVFCI